MATRCKTWYNTIIMVIKLCEDKEILIYTAGIIDGEGYISIMKKKAIGEYHRVPFYAMAVIKVASVDRRLTDFLYEKFGGYLNKRISKIADHKDSWQWEMKGTTRVNQLLKLVYPYLRIKKESADVVIKFTDMFIESKISGRHRGCRPTTEELYKKLEEYINLARSYTARGHDTHRNATSAAETK